MPLGSFFYLKQGDLLPRIRSTLTDANGNPINLVGASVTFIMRALGAALPQVSGSATVIDGLNGIVEYAWKGIDTSIPGSFAAEWVATIGGQQMTIPNLNYVNVLISPNLQGGVAPVPVPPPPSLTFAAQVLVVTNPKPSDGVSVNGVGIVANSSNNVMPGAFTAPDVPRGVRAAFPPGWDGGNLVVVGLDQFGAAATGVITANPGGFGDTSQIFSSVTGVTKTVVGVTAGVATVGFGMRLGILAKCVNTAAQLSADNAPEGGIFDIVNNSFIPTTQPNGNVTYQLIVNV